MGAGFGTVLPLVEAEPGCADILDRAPGGATEGAAPPPAMAISKDNASGSGAVDGAASLVVPCLPKAVGDSAAAVVGAIGSASGA